MHGTFAAFTCYGSVLAVDLAAHELVHARTIGPERPRALVHIPRGSPFGFILFDNPRQQPFAPHAHKPSAPIIVVRLRPMRGGIFAFCHAFEQRYLGAHSELAESGTGMTAFFGNEIAEWQQYKLACTSDRRLPIAIRHQVTLITRAVEIPPTSILDLLRAAPPFDRSLLASLLTATLTPAQIAAFVQDLLDHRTDINALAALFPGDPWANIGFPALRHFLEDRRKQSNPFRLPRGRATSPDPPIGEVDSKLDRLAVDGLFGEYVSLPHRCIAAARREVEPTQDICIVACARDDGLYLLEWLAYYRSIGVEQVFIYTNDNKDGSDRLLRALAKAGEIVLFENKVRLGGVSPVYKAYGHALSMMPEVLDYRWCAIIDPDELIGFDRQSYGSLKGYIAWQASQRVDAIALNWLVFGSSGALHWHDAPMLSRFRERYVDPHVNTIFRPRLFHHATGHCPITSRPSDVVCRNAVGEPYPVGTPHSPAPRDNPAWIAHYFYRSFEEFIWKFSRGRGDEPLRTALPEVNVPEQFMQGFVRQHRELTLNRDDRMLAFAPGMEAEAERLRSLPGVANALQQIHAFYHRRAANLEPLLETLRAAASPSQAAFYDLFLCRD